MRTTLDIKDAILKKARKKAAERGTTLTRVVQEALEHYLMPKPPEPKPFDFDRDWIVVKGEAPPAVDISDRKALYDFMEPRPKWLP